MLVCRRLPDFYPGRTRSHNPGAKYRNLFDWLRQIAWDLELSNLLPPLENPYAEMATCSFSAPCCEDSVLPGECRCDVSWCLRSSEENQIQALEKVVGMKASSNGGCDLEGRLSKWEGGKWDGSRGDKAYCLSSFRSVTTIPHV